MAAVVRVSVEVDGVLIEVTSRDLVEGLNSRSDVVSELLEDAHGRVQAALNG